MTKDIADLYRMCAFGFPLVPIANLHGWREWFEERHMEML